MLCTSKDKATLYKDTENKVIQPTPPTPSSLHTTQPDCLFNVGHILGSRCISKCTMATFLILSNVVRVRAFHRRCWNVIQIDLQRDFYDWTPGLK